MIIRANWSMLIAHHTPARPNRLLRKKERGIRQTQIPKPAGIIGVTVSPAPQRTLACCYLLGIREIPMIRELGAQGDDRCIICKQPHQNRGPKTR